MTRGIVRSLAVVSLCLALLLGSGGSARAWYNVKNNTPNTIWISHAFASTSGFLCGWNDGCDDNTTWGWKIEGWWLIRAGATVTINGQGWGNAMHEIYAHDSLGHVWGGNGGWWGTPNTAFSRCEGLFSQEGQMPYYTYLQIRETWCCGGSCTGDFTTTLIL